MFCCLERKDSLSSTETYYAVKDHQHKPVETEKSFTVAAMGSDTNACQWNGCGRTFEAAEALLAHITSTHIRLAPSKNEKANADPTSPYLCKPLTPGVENVTKESPMRMRMEDLVLRAQAHIVRALEKIDGSQFRIDQWERAEGGGGVTAVLQDSRVFEKAGVAVSVVHGHLPPAAVQQMRARGKEMGGDPSTPVPFFACGVSLVIHGHNPHVPTAHANYRYFEIPDAANPSKPKMWWFGGGADLTPTYLVEEDAVHFHTVLKEGCDLHDKNYYPRFKKWCDEYFYIPHRGECRGVGGIFFDDLDSAPMEELFAFVTDMAMRFVPAYCPIVEKHKDEAFTAAQKLWQQLRRGRYVEFNLAIDRGTKFGLATPGSRTESILMSLPLTARWEYMATPAEDSAEAQLMAVLRTPRQWLQ